MIKAKNDNMHKSMDKHAAIKYSAKWDIYKGNKKVTWVHDILGD